MWLDSGRLTGCIAHPASCCCPDPAYLPKMPFRNPRLAGGASS